MSSSGLIYAMIVGAWAAYLVPMWLRRQDELNEARPTERFSTAIRLLTGRGGADRSQDRDGADSGADAGAGLDPAPVAGAGEGAGDDDESPDAAPAAGGVVDVRAAAVPVTDPRAAAPRPRRTRKETPAAPVARQGVTARADEEPEAAPAARTDAQAGGTAGPRAPEENPPAPSARNPHSPSTPERRARARVLARRRRTLTLLFVALTAGAVAASVGGPRFLWAVVVPVVLLTAYVVRVRTQERRRRTFTADQARGEAAARRLREDREAAPRRPQESAPDSGDGDARDAEAGTGDDPSATAPFDAPAAAYEADRRALVEQTDHAEWVDQQRERDRPADAGWDPVPVPLPTYVTAPVAPRATRGLDLDAPDTWSSARSSTAEPQQPHQEPPPADPTPEAAPPPRRPTNRTPLFDQYADPPRRRAANE
ncbi:gephyrin-like molybdotransferase receptor GlpR [Streptomyces sp. NPDC004134]|uniref:divisome protein SepX/GlpR n=1 Tax=Streptomyces sp. NPDC004134 TaxID=3364691 RepID=UPI0036B4E800